MTNAAKLAKAVKAEERAYEALMNDPKVIADPSQEHTSELYAEWERTLADLNWLQDAT